MPEINQTQGGLSWSMPSSAETIKGATKTAPVLPQAKNTQRIGGAAKYAGFFALGVIAGILLAWAWSAWRVDISSTSAQTGAETGAEGKKTASPAAEGGLVVATPQRAGLSVQVESAAVFAPTWIVVYENRNGEPGNALGATLFFPEGRGGGVTLLRATIPGQTYLVGKRADDGDRKFSLSKDAPINENGVPKFVQFTAN